jgi:hypothetical protein
VNNKLIRLAELVQEDFPENLLTAFKSPANTTLAQRLGIASQAIASHQKRAEDLWLKAGRKRSPRERQASARAELAAFLFACLSGDAPEYADSAREALRALGRQGETGLVNSLCRK